MFQVSSLGIASFKLGDNIVFNLKILNEVYILSRNNDYLGVIFRKIKIILIVSIIEAIIYDLHHRIKSFTHEKVNNLKDEIAIKLRKNKNDKFGALIDISKKHHLFNELGDTFYENLHTLRKIRNRVHIQNENRDFEKDDVHAFSNEKLILAEQCLEQTVKLILFKYSRDASKLFVEPFIFPWEEYFPGGNEPPLPNQQQV